MVITGLILSLALALQSCGGSGVSLPSDDSPGINSDSADFGSGNLNIANAKSSWTILTVDSANNVGMQTSIGVGLGSEPISQQGAVLTAGVMSTFPPVRISYYDQYARRLLLASGLTNCVFTHVPLDGNRDDGKYNSLIWNGVTAPRVVYYRQSAPALGGAFRAHQGYTQQMV
ncbi:MAG: hypothetical protein ACREDU_06300, partial [Methylocella sp.]